MKRLNAGCGLDALGGWTNLDKVKLPGVDIVHDLSNIPLPFRAEEFDEILRYCARTCWSISITFPCSASSTAS